MRARTTAKQPELQASSKWYGTKEVQSVTNETKQDIAIRELNKLFEV